MDTGRYTILGACNPPLARQAITADPDTMRDLSGEPALEDVAADAKQRLETRTPRPGGINASDRKVIEFSHPTRCPAPLRAPPLRGVTAASAVAGALLGSRRGATLRRAGGAGR
ncbi:hypothetical protein BH20ACT9_BH20ACT9_07250 [soil metagenome]